MDRNTAAAVPVGQPSLPQPEAAVTTSGAPPSTRPPESSKEGDKTQAPMVPPQSLGTEAAAGDTADSHPAPTSTSPHSSSESKTESALETLLQLLNADDSVDTAPPPSLHALQKMCMRMPHLSNELTRPQRFQLYRMLLLNAGEEDGPGEVVVTGPTPWTTYTGHALEAHTHLAKQAAALFSETSQITSDELAGLFYRLGAETAFPFHAETMDIALCVTYVVAGSRSTDKDMLLTTLYRLLAVLQKDFLPSVASRVYAPAATALLRLMLQFFDPLLATHLDHHQVDIGPYVLSWSRRLLIVHADFEVALRVLDWIFILGDPVMVPYVVHAYLLTHRQHLLSLDTKLSLVTYLDALTFVLPTSKAHAVDPKLVDGRAVAPIPVWSGKSLLQNADLLFRITPLSTQRMLDFFLFPDVGTLSKTPEELRRYYADAPCLPLERSDIASAFPRRPMGEALAATSDAELRRADRPPREYIIVDCRSRDSFEYARLPSAILVGDVLSYQPEELAEAMQRLESCRGHPLALFGTGRSIVEELNLLKVLALYLVHRKAFAFVCIVPGGFKTTIPLMRNHVIEVVMSSTAAAALGGAAGRRSTAFIDWGQQASNTAHALSSALSGVSGYLPHVEGSEVRQRAEELRVKAKEGVSAAGSWGWGMLQRVREGLSETRDHASAALSTVATSISETGATSLSSRNKGPASSAPSGTSPFVAASTTKATSERPPHIPTATALPTAPKSSQPQQQQQHVFSLDEDGDEDDLDLITSIPARPLRGKEMPETTTNAPGPLSSAAALLNVPSATAPQPVSPPAQGVLPSSTPQPFHSPTATRASPKENAAVRIAASIDAEFDELFGNVSTAPPPTTSTTAAAALHAATATYGTSNSAPSGSSVA